MVEQKKAIDIEELIHKVRKYTFLPTVKLRKIATILAELDEKKVPGAIVECGVYKGGCSAFMASLSENRKVWLLDSFRGLPQPTKEDISKRRLGDPGRRTIKELIDDKPIQPINWCIGTREEVEHVMFDIAEIERSRVGIVEGWLQDTLPAFNPGSIAFLHIDVDWYESTKLCLEHLYDKIAPGGYTGMDDYYYWKGSRLALDQFLKNQPPAKLERSGSAVYWRVD